MPKFKLWLQALTKKTINIVLKNILLRWTKRHTCQPHSQEKSWFEEEGIQNFDKVALEDGLALLRKGRHGPYPMRIRERDLRKSNCVSLPNINKYNPKEIGGMVKLIVYILTLN